ncbi:Kunitz/Bovine pancreatic trypsin inhibitor domain protein [Oesophagostomum dentatum]|uniref:Kunitz/Bovine pancreatic trypsin inhibitor domain protein n=1 Tax=Oesophagostomum dentatum TaxID=61180 RepID=A0A0B1T3G2_OESDE|nr:Kunitz/Bovine pancreatic trypsin inhibitor domain protein [Oesophagostomum dentatum]
MFFAAVLFALLTVLAEQQKTSWKSDCTAKLNRGNDECSDSNPELRFYYHNKIGRCLAFQYKGCGGNNNNYKTFTDCYLECGEDLFNCGGGEPATGKCVNMKGCPKGSFCRMGPSSGTGVCCDRKLEEEYEKDRDPKCNTGNVAVVNCSGRGDQALLGRSCKHNFCPYGSQCVPGRYLAHCCGTEWKFGKKNPGSH